MRVVPVEPKWLRISKLSELLVLTAVRALFRNTPFTYLLNTNENKRPEPPEHNQAKSCNKQIAGVPKLMHKGWGLGPFAVLSDFVLTSLGVS